MVILHGNISEFLSDTGGVASRLLGLKGIQLSSPKELKPEWVAMYERQENLRTVE